MFGLRRILGRARPGLSGLSGPPGPAPVTRPVWLVGDVHGRADLLEGALAALRPPEGAAVVLLGDMIDRGPDPAGALRIARSLPRRWPGVEGVALMGNHERMMLDFLDAPVQRGRRWLRHGGRETLQGFGVDPGPPAAEPGPEALRALREALRAAMEPGLEGWLRALPLLWRDGGLVAAHAGLDPLAPPEAQDEEALLWGRTDFRRPRRDGLWVAHGHVVTAAPEIVPGRLGLDTGAWRTGRLTVARLRPGEAPAVERPAAPEASRGPHDGLPKAD
ncbi:metallophosphoesterase [Hasllibacter halocynthiae]|uniref:metallophosphoesterase n=1 Tax=Hasllibacter halocynthiae TaxID=595589 RepID=UPI001304CD35|nr:metallophosphoesterase [Hasllibacter halocynthiae]